MKLTPRQRACLQVAAAGETECEIAATLGIAPATVRNHLLRARACLGARNTTAAVARAQAAGWLEIAPLARPNDEFSRATHLASDPDDATSPCRRADDGADQGHYGGALDR